MSRFVVGAWGWSELLGRTVPGWSLSALAVFAGLATAVYLLRVITVKTVDYLTPTRFHTAGPMSSDEIAATNAAELLFRRARNARRGHRMAGQLRLAVRWLVATPVLMISAIIAFCLLWRRDR